MCKNKPRYTIDNDSEQLLSKYEDEKIDLIRQTELVFAMAKLVLDDEKIKEELLYHFSSGCYYLDIYKNHIELYGYEYSIKKENLNKYEINFISEIKKVFNNGGNLKIYCKEVLYIIPNLKHVELIEYQFIDFLGRYKEKILKHEYKSI